MMGLGSWLDRRSAIAPEQPAIIEGPTVRNYAEMAVRVRRLANGLRNLGVREGDRVGWLGPNRAAFLELLFATAKVGAVFAPVNHRLSETEIVSIVSIASPRVVAADGFLAELELPSSVEARVVVGADANDESYPRSYVYEEFLANSPDVAVEVPAQMDRLCLLPHTSGTTGSPKGIMLTEGNVTWNVLNMVSSADIRPGDVTIAIAPFFRTGGVGVNVLPVLFKGGTIVIPERVEADEILRLCEAHRVTIGFGNPDLLQAVADSPLWHSSDLSSVRFIITGGAPVPERLIRRYLEKGLPLLQGYGLSEAAPVVLLLPQERALTKAGAAGQPLTFVEVKIVREDGTECGTDETGELLVRGPNVMAGYWNRPEDTKRTLEPTGWLHTGDAGRMDADWDVWIVDRIADAYRSGERVVYPGDVERVLLGHPAVDDAGVVGMGGSADGLGWGAAFVTLRAGSLVTEDELLAWCRDRAPPHMRPRWVRVLRLMPRTQVGKLLRSELRRLAPPPAQ